jgi:hypothetical protein
MEPIADILLGGLNANTRGTIAAGGLYKRPVWNPVHFGRFLTIAEVQVGHEGIQGSHEPGRHEYNAC